MRAPQEGIRQQAKEAVIHTAAVAYEKIWQHFPEEARPDKSLLPTKDNVVIGRLPDDTSEFHPKMKEDVRVASEKALADSNQSAKLNKVSMSNEGIYTFTLPLFRLPEDLIRRTVYYQTAAMMQNSVPPILPAQYDEETKKHVRETLDLMLTPNHGVHVEETRIERQGFRWLLEADKYVVAELTPMGLERYNEVFPLAFEFITAEAVKRGSNLIALDEAIVEQQIEFDQHVTSPRYHATLFYIAELVGWRTILTALTMGDPQDMVDYLRPSLGEKAMGAVVTLLKSASDDDRFIEEMNRVHYATRAN